MSKIACVLVLLIGCPPLSAETSAAQARRLYQAGAKDFDLGDYTQALDEFKAAYRAKDNPLLLYNIAQCQRLTGQSEDAIHSYEAYLRRSPDAPNRDDVEAKITALKQAIAAREKAASSPPTQYATVPSLGSEPSPAAAAPSDAARLTAQAAPAPKKKPLYKRWWLWTAVGGVVAAGLTVGLVVGLRSSSPPTFPAVGL